MMRPAAAVASARRLDVEPERAIPGLGCHRQERLTCAKSGIVDQDVEPTQQPRRVLDSLFAVLDQVDREAMPAAGPGHGFAPACVESATTTFAPRSPAASATARPNPLAPPVTRSRTGSSRSLSPHMIGDPECSECQIRSTRELPTQRKPALDFLPRPAGMTARQHFGAGPIEQDNKTGKTCPGHGNTNAAWGNGRWPMSARAPARCRSLASPRLRDRPAVRRSQRNAASRETSNP